MAITTTAALLGGAALSAGASIFGANAQASAAKKAANAQTAAQDKNIALQKEIFDKQSATLQPWQTAGLDALKKIQTGIADGSFDLSKYSYDDLVKDPGYQFRVDQGTNALERAAAARGKFVSGDQINALQDFGQQMASQEFGNAFARAQSERDTRVNLLSGIADRGYGAATALSGVAGQMGDRISTANTNIGNAQATGAINQGNAWAGLATNLAKTGNNALENYLLYDRLKVA